ncbi:hypothetical protein CL622_08560 [archaeon]|nr:hypothetical protein [archaeon]|tara:strand:+ start:728 stop:1195 length:468 start_codon:yes stop_codon:yes gene_type:complete
MHLDLTISDYNISGEPLPENVADLILQNHIVPMQEVINKMPVAVAVSKKSGFRSWLWEKQKNRSGNSQHCFGHQEDGSFNSTAKGAADYTCDDFAHQVEVFAELIAKETEYTRICIYPNKLFIHADFKHPKKNECQIFYDHSDGNSWQYQKTISK